MKKRLLCILLSVLMVFSLLPAGAVATEEAGETISYTDWTATDSLPTSGTYRLTNNVTVSSGITVVSGNTLTLDLNGKTITGSSLTDLKSLFTVNGSLTLTDSSTEKTGSITTGGKGYAVNVKTGGSFTMNNGTITTCKYGVYLADSATFTMNDGTITGCTYNIAVGSSSSGKAGSVIAINGGTVNNSINGVYIYGSSSGTKTKVIMTGGIITGINLSTAASAETSRLAAVLLINADFEMKGGCIKDNTYTTYTYTDTYWDFGGIYVGDNSTFTMSGGEISGNTSVNGGGVYVKSGGTFTMTGGTITGNTSNGTGGGVCNAGTFTMSGGTISDNTAGGTYGTYSEGVYGSITMNGGTISGHKTGIRAYSGATVAIGGGIVTGNTTYGIYLDNATLTLTSGAIYNNNIDIKSYGTSSSITLIEASSMTADGVTFTGWYSGSTEGDKIIDTTLTGAYEIVAASSEATEPVENWLDDYDNTTVFTISSISDWLSFVDAVNNQGYTFEGKTVQLAADLDFTDVTVAPVGTATYNFKGTFDGQNHTISNMSYTDYTSISYAGVFGVTSGATIKNLTVSGCTFKAATTQSAGYAGAIVASALSNTVIENCTSTNNYVEAWFAGGITGHTVSTTIKDVTVSGTTFAANTKSGCVIGYDGGGTTVDGAEVNSTLTQSGSLPGAVIGQANGTSTLSNLDVTASGLYVIGSMETNNEYTVTITGDENSVTAAAIAGNVLTNTTLVITGGNYTVDDIVSGEETSAVSGTVSISGGTYSTSLDENYIATGYEAVEVEGEEGKYTVSAEATWIVADNVRNGTDLAMGFYIPQSAMENVSDYTVTITLTYSDTSRKLGTTKDVTYSVSVKSGDAAWGTGTYDGDSCYFIIFEGICAYQMVDKVTVDIYCNDTKVCETYETSIESYENRFYAYEGATESGKALASAILAYGAAAQTFYEYNEGDLASLSN
ncbi:MAG: hypothetical protein LUH18_09585 [Oscillospiraceae bacterium]|nr:hypothetical protein [Oscillospiraceae bacterium]